MARQFRLEIIEEDGRVSKVYGTLPPASTTPPAAPILVRAESVTAALVVLSWANSPDGGIATTWQVYRGGAPLSGLLLSPAYTDTAVAPSTAYSYEIQAFNEGGSSPLSDPFVITTSVNTAPAWTLADLSATLGAAYSLDLTTVCTDVDGHTLSFSVSAGAVPGLSIAGAYLAGTPTTAGAFSLTLDAFDNYDHTQVTITFTVVDTDNTAPSVPANVLAVANGSTVRVTWDASTDASGISAYRIRRDNVYRDSVAGDVLEYTESGVSDGTYTYTVRAVDASANLNTSASSTGSTVTVSVVNPTPDVPSSLAVVAASSSQLNISWAAGPNGATPTGYRLQRANTLAGTYSTVYEGASTSFSDTGLPTATARYYKVLAKNGANESAYSTPVSGTTQNASGGAADFVIPVSTSARTITNNAPASGLAIAYGSTTWASLATGSKTRPQAGDIIELAAGTHGKLTVTLNGSASGYVTLRASRSARVTISAATSFVFTYASCSYLTIDGGVIGTQYGLLFTAPSSSSGVGHFVKCSGRSHHITIRNFEIDGKVTSWSGTPAAAIPIGLGLHDNTLLRANNNSVFHHDILVENFYAHSLRGEAIYGGPNWTTGAVPMKDVTIRNGVIEDTGRDGIQVKAPYEGTNVVDNVVCRRVGRNNYDRDAGQLFGISIACGTARVSNCRIYDSGESGIQFYTQNGPFVDTAFDGYGPYTEFAVEAYNNLVVRAGSGLARTGKVMGQAPAPAGCSAANAGNGIVAGADTDTNAAGKGMVPPLPNFYNNTVANCEQYGINIGSRCKAGGVVSNNVLIGNGTALNLGVTTTNVGNYSTGTPFANPSNTFNASGDDYHLTLARPVSGTAVAAVDLDGDARSLATADSGCYEYP